MTHLHARSSKSQSSFACWSIALVVMIGCSSGDHPATLPPETTAPQTSAEETLSRMLAVYRNAESYTDQATYSRRRVKRTEGVIRDTVIHEMSLALGKPNRLRFTYQQLYPRSQSHVSYDIASDGTTVHSAVGSLPEQIHEIASPAVLTAENFIPEPNIRAAALAVSLENIYPQLAIMLDTGQDEQVFPHDSRPRMLKQEKIDERLCHRVALDSNAGKRTLWIDADTHLLLRMELPLEAQKLELDPHDEFSQYTVWIDYDNPIMDSKLKTETFTMQIPDTARRVSRLVMSPPSAPSSKLGKPVRAYSFTTLDDQEITPESHPGKVVVLDFWSVSCPPCRQQTPLLNEVYQQLKDDDRFVFYAVNANLAKAGISNARILEVFESWGGTFPVLRDLAETSDFELGIRAYPHMVIVGTDGRLQYDEPGMHTAAEPLVELIQKLLDGGDPAAEAHAQHEKLVEQYERDLEEATLGKVQSVASTGPISDE